MSDWEAREWEAEPGTLYLVGTPIGNLADWSFRARSLLMHVDAILAEDTRVTGQLCQAAGIHVPLLSFHQHNTQERIPEVIRRLKQGERLALVSDRGMPAISDPGQELVDAVWQEGLRISVVPGPSAAIAAYAASGFPAPFTFWGFLPRAGKARRARLEEIRAWPHGQILYEAPHRMAATLRDLAQMLGRERRVLVGREMTKRHEEFWRGPLGQLLEEERAWRGECVVVIAPADKKPETLEVDWDQLALRVRALTQAGTPPATAVAQVAKEAGVSRRALYEYCQRR
ncbi:MAG: 16S rRNA (cytidine(1402)-2'-O)-methyltransferase [Firmicutes bacterium]|nr:16S rRNA (cytidine(1402)-2'-O)-methyltransferase [Bacillota bacterium]